MQSQNHEIEKILGNVKELTDLSILKLNHRESERPWHKQEWLNLVNIKSGSVESLKKFNLRRESQKVSVLKIFQGFST